jgi:antitoxin MazE
MRTKLVQIGNSKGIRLPRAVIEQCSLGDEIELVVKKDHLIVKSAKRPREGWEEAFKEMHENGDDRILDETDAHTETETDRREWKW